MFVEKGGEGEGEREKGLGSIKDTLRSQTVSTVLFLGAVGKLSKKGKDIFY